MSDVSRLFLLLIIAVRGFDRFSSVIMNHADCVNGGLPQPAETLREVFPPGGVVWNW